MTSQTHNTLTPHSLLSLMKASESSHIYALSSIERRVTVYSQQIRALNLVFSLFEEQILTKGKAVAVIGGGIAGITAAAGAALKGCKVILYERRPDLLHMQSGNDTRWIHPKIYDWPDKDAELPTADLPIFRWRMDRAGAVAEQLLKQFESIIDQATKNGGSLEKKYNAHDIKLHETLNASTLSVCPSNSVPDLHDVAIIATGFGVEKTWTGVPFLSYWMNDWFAQPEMHPSRGRRQPPGASGRTSYLISGTGDGGLIDLFRVRINRFRQDKIISEFFPDTPDTQALLSNLRTIKKELFGPTALKPSLSIKYSTLKSTAGYKNVKDILQTRLRKDTCAVLHGESEMINTNSSMLHSFLAFLLSDIDSEHFRYENSSLKTISPHHGRWKATFKSDAKRSQATLFDHVIIRHGAQLVIDKGNIHKYREAHKKRLLKLDSEDWSRDYRMDLTGSLLPGNTSAWWAPFPSFSIPTASSNYINPTSCDQHAELLFRATRSIRFIMGTNFFRNTITTQRDYLAAYRDALRAKLLQSPAIDYREIAISDAHESGLLLENIARSIQSNVLAEQHIRLLESTPGSLLEFMVIDSSELLVSYIHETNKPVHIHIQAPSLSRLFESFFDDWWRTAPSIRLQNQTILLGAPSNWRELRRVEIDPGDTHVTAYFALKDSRNPETLRNLDIIHYDIFIEVKNTPPNALAASMKTKQGTLNLLPTSSGGFKFKHRFIDFSTIEIDILIGYGQIIRIQRKLDDALLKGYGQALPENVRSAFNQLSRQTSK